MNSTMRLIVGVAVVAVAVVLFVVLSGGGEDSSSDGTGAAEPAAKGKPGPAVPTIFVKHGKPSGGVKELDFRAGEQIRFKVVSDVSDEVHVHGYDIPKDVKAGGSVEFDFPASIEGLFEVELEGRGEQIAELRVNP